MDVCSVFYPTESYSKYANSFASMPPNAAAFLFAFIEQSLNGRDFEDGLGGNNLLPLDMHSPSAPMLPAEAEWVANEAVAAHETLPWQF